MDFPKDFEIESPWVPVTPTKPILTKRSPVLGSEWLGSGDVSPGRNDSSWDPSSWSQATAAALASASQQTQTCTNNVREVRTQAFNHPNPMPNPYGTLLAQFASSRNSSQMMPSASPSQNHFLLNGNSVPTFGASIGSNWPMRPPVPKSQYLSPTILPNLNSVPENSITNTVNVVSPVTPAKLGQNMRTQDCRPVEIVDLGDNNTMFQSIQMNEFDKVQQPTEEETQLSFSTPGEPTCSVSLQQQEGEVNTISLTENSLQQAEGENQGIDLNKTPQQKPKRKKHRPKVMREGKPARTPKPVTPKPVTPRVAKKTENPPQGKRKYVRKKKDPVSEENPSDAVGDAVNPQSESGSKSVRRSLNFDSEDCQARDVRPGSETMPPQGKRKYVRKKKDLVSKENPSDVVGDVVNPQNESGSKSVRCSLNFDSEDCQARDVRPGSETMSPQGKRRYVRKKKDLVSKENPSDVVGDVVNPQSESGSTSVRCSLNFDSEDCQARDARPGSEMMSTYNADSHAVFAGSTAKSDMQSVQGWDSRVLGNPQVSTANSSANSDMQSVQVRGSTMLENSLSDRSSFDLNSSVNQLDADYLMTPQTPNPPSQPSRQEVMRTIQMQDLYIRTLNNTLLPPQPARREGENMKKLARKNSYLKLVGDRDISLEAGQNQIATDNISEALLKGTKRDRTLADDAQVSGSSSLMHAYNRTNNGSDSCDMSRNGNCSPEIYKKKRMDTQNEGPSAYSTFTCTSSCLKTVQTAQNTSGAFTFADAQRFMVYKKLRALRHMRHMLVIEQAERTANDRSLQDQSPPSLNAGVSNQRASTTLMPPGHNSATCQPSTPEKPFGFACNPDQSSPSPNSGVGNQGASTPVSSSSNNSAGCQPSTPEKPSAHTYSQDNMSIGPQARIETAIASKKLKLKGRGRKKEQVPVNPMSSNAKQLGIENEVATSTTVPSHGQESPNNSPSTKKSAQSTSRKDSNLPRSSVQDCQSTNNYKGSVPRCSQLGTIIPYQDPVDAIVQKLRHLNINEGDKNINAQEQNALVPYVGGAGMMVVYNGPKKWKPRPKVDLDPESDRVWRLLMGKECGNAEGEMGTDKEKWWEEERRVFRGRADSFIARMHLVQGDRRFSKWKGSVVDSVIGVFLTQNVSDHLSSSAFMSLAAKFPKFPVRSSGNNHTTNVEKINMPSGDIITGQGKMPEKQPCDASSVVIHETEQVDDKEMENCHESPESNTGSSTLDYLDSNNLNCHDGELGIGHESPDCGSANAVTVTSSTSGVEGEDRSLMEDVVSSQNSVVSSQSSPKCLVQATDQGKLNSLLNFDCDDFQSGGSFTELLKMASSRGLREFRGHGNGRTSSLEHTAGINQLRNIGNDQRPSLATPSDYPRSAGPSIYKTNSHFQSIQSDLISSSCAPSLSCNYQTSVTSKFVGLQNAGVLEEGKQYNISPDASATNKTSRIEIMGQQCSPSAENSRKHINESCMQPVISLGSEIRLEMNSCSQNNVVKKTTHASSDRNISSGFSLSGENIAIFQGKEKEATFQVDSSQHEAKAQAQIRNFVTPQTCSKGYNNNNNQENTLEGVRAVEPNLGKETSISQAEALKNLSKAKTVKAEADKKKSFDWDSLRKQACPNGVKKERNSEAMDSLDYEALRNADVNVIAYTIRERGMNNMLAERIKDFLNRLVRDHGSVDLEWLRDVPPDKAKDYLLSVRGLGLKSVECVRLLTLHHLAFPVDTNVGRIAVRLGWVPLQPLPESLQLHLLEMYPILETIQKYLWPRLCKLDQRTLYELHYQLITFGKVFCTKAKPNCNACPMRGECKHFASAFASARLALPAPEEKRLVPSTIPNFPEINHAPILKSVPHPQLEGCTHTQDGTVSRNCEPIIEEPASPEPECIEALESAIEDAFFNDPDEIPTIKLDMEEFTQNLQSYIKKNNMELQDGDMSKALVAVTADAASIPMPKLKNVSRLRTEHQVYELPDSHPLLEGMDRRERDDPSPYLLAIWTPGETAQSTEPPEVCCNSHDTGNLCKENTCFSCNSLREAQAQVVRGTILIPCRTAMRGSFPLNGTYFQVNEVFADHDSSRQPIDVPRNWIWNLPRRTVYFGTSMPTIFKGLSTEGIQHCFWRGFVCVRGFDRTTKNPKPLYARLHFPASKTTKEKRAAAEKESKHD